MVCPNHMRGRLRCSSPLVYVILTVVASLEQSCDSEKNELCSLQNTGSRNNTGYCSEHCPLPFPQAPYLVCVDAGFLNKCCVDLLYSKFLTNKCHCSFAVVQIYFDKFSAPTSGPFSIHCLLPLGLVTVALSPRYHFDLPQFS